MSDDFQNSDDEALGDDSLRDEVLGPTRADSMEDLGGSLSCDSDSVDKVTSDGAATAEAREVAGAPVAPEPAPFDAGLLLKRVDDGQRALASLARAAIEVLQVGIEAVTGEPANVESVVWTLTDFEEIQRDFEARDHVSVELRVSLSATDAQLATALVPLEDAGHLFGIDPSAMAMSDGTSAAPPMLTIDRRVSELLDVVSLTLFADGLAGAEVTASEVRRGQIESTLGTVRDVARGAPPVRVDFVAKTQDGSPVRLTLVLPGPLFSRIIDLLPVDTASAAASSHASSAGGAARTSSDDPRLGARVPSNLSPLPLGGETSPFEPLDAEPPAPTLAGDEAAVYPTRLPLLPERANLETSPRPTDLMMDVSMHVTVELGRSTLTVEEILELNPGSVVELNRLAGEPVDILVKARLIARGEVVIVDQNIGVRITEITSPRQRASAMTSSPNRRPAE